MSVQVKWRRDTAANNLAFVGAQGEIVVDVDNMRMIAHDGVTVGGFAAAQLSETGSLIVVAKAVNANLVADTPLAIKLPGGVTRYRIRRVSAFATTLSLTAARGALYNAAGGSGVAICSPQALSGLTNATTATAGNAIDLTLALAAPVFFTAATLYFRITTAQGAAATFDAALVIEPYD